ncbi:hypothetical protein MMC20_004382 [Loxospora ochrophaea]|nr:hypothetical protein [Loxospora ochrophaea]
MSVSDFDGEHPRQILVENICALTQLDTDMSGAPFDFSSDLLNDDATSPDFNLMNSPADSTYTYPLDNVPSVEPINGPVSVQTSTQTISPKDIMMDTMSAPPSTAYTNISTPGTYSLESPYITTSADTSPMFGHDDLNENPESWAPLFPTDSNPSAFPASPSGKTELQNFDLAAAPPMSRNESSPGQSSSRGSNQGRHSSISGVGARKRDKPLPPITVDDPNDIVAVKRARNTAAARKSRQKKMEKFDELEQEISRLQGEVEHWKSMALGRTSGGA